MYEYKATLIRVVDGDTVWLRVDLGFRMFAEMDFRLLGINAPELTGPNAEVEKAQASKAHLNLILRNAIMDPLPLRIQTTKPDKYGRWLVTIFTPDGRNINDEMVAGGFAVKYP
jgi:micrococcal nuclease